MIDGNLAVQPQVISTVINYPAVNPLTAKGWIKDYTFEELRRMADDARRIVALSLDIFTEESYTRLYELDKVEASIDLQKTELISHHVDRLMEGTCEPFAGITFTNVVTELERIGDHAENIAYALSDQDPS